MSYNKGDEFKAIESDLYLSGNDKTSKICELSNELADMERNYEALKTEVSFYENKVAELRIKMSSLKKNKTSVKKRIDSISQLSDNVSPIYEFDHLIQTLKLVKIVNPKENHNHKNYDNNIKWQHFEMDSPLGTISLYTPGYCYNDFYVISTPRAEKANALVKMLNKNFVVNKDAVGAVVLYAIKM
jgi:hypothetical protein